MKIQKKSSRHSDILILCIVVLLVLTGSIAVYIHNQNAVFHYAQELDETVISMKDSEIRLRELTYYFMVEEETVNETALVYNPEKPLEYWGLYIDNKFVSDEAKKTAVDFCIRDVIYSQYAMEAGMKLTKEELAEIENTACQMAQDLTDKQIKLQLTKDDISLAMQRNKLADSYVLKLAKEKKLSMTEEVLSAYYGLNSNYFKEAKTTMKVKVDEKFLEDVRLGTLTIN